MKAVTTKVVNKKDDKKPVGSAVASLVSCFMFFPPVVTMVINKMIMGLVCRLRVYGALPASFFSQFLAGASTNASSGKVCSPPSNGTNENHPCCQRINSKSSAFGTVAKP
ncbi:MAG: hypothetical protein M3498_05675 [Deinococcota bacterium]|nr:hypothetical protein [Deinococcota bacterium]